MQDILNWVSKSDNIKFITLWISVLTFFLGSGISIRLGCTIYKYFFGGGDDDSVIGITEYGLSDCKNQIKIKKKLVRKHSWCFICFGILISTSFYYIAKLLGIFLTNKWLYLNAVFVYITISSVLGFCLLWIVYKKKVLIWLIMYGFIFLCMIWIYYIVTKFNIFIMLFLVFLVILIGLYFGYDSTKKNIFIEIQKKKNEGRAAYYKAVGYTGMYVSLALLLLVVYEWLLLNSRIKGIIIVISLIIILSIFFCVIIFKIFTTYYDGILNVSFIYYRDRKNGKKIYIYTKANNQFLCGYKDYKKWNKKEFDSKMKKFESEIKKLYTDDKEKLIEIMIQINKLSVYSESIRVDAGCGKDYFDLLDKMQKIKTDKLFNILNNKLDEMINSFEEMTAVELINEDMLVNVKIYQVHDEYQSYYFL